MDDENNCSKHFKVHIFFDKNGLFFSFRMNFVQILVQSLKIAIFLTIKEAHSSNFALSFE